MLPNVLVANQCDHTLWTVSVRGVEIHMERSLRKKKSPQGKRRIDRENKSDKKKRTSEYIRIEIGRATPSGRTLLETTTLYYAITSLQVCGEEIDLFLVVAMHGNIATYS